MVSLPFALLAVFMARFGNRGGMLSLRKSMKRRLGLKFEKGAEGFAPGKGDVCISGAPLPALGGDTANYLLRGGKAQNRFLSLSVGVGSLKDSSSIGARRALEFAERSVLWAGAFRAGKSLSRSWVGWSLSGTELQLLHKILCLEKPLRELR